MKNDWESLKTAALDNFSLPGGNKTINETSWNLCVVKRNLLKFNRILYELEHAEKIMENHFNRKKS